MKINNISGLNFGYNKQYHSEVKEYLDKQTTNPLAQTMLEADKFCMSVEDKITNLEKVNDVDSEEFENLWAFFVDLKDRVAKSMDLNFPKLNYSKNEAEQYTKEASEFPNGSTWREVLSNFMTDLADEDYAEAQEPTPPSLPRENIKPNQTKKEQNNTDADISDLVTLFEATKSSPKGFVDVSGMGELKEKLREEIVEYIDNPMQAYLDFEEYGIEAPRGFLFYGPPGCGKTYITEALASEADTKMFKLDVSKIGSKYVNQTANNLQAAFDYMKSVADKEEKPVLLFMDEVDSLAIKRDGANNNSENLKATTALLKLIQEAKDNNIIVIAATNKYDLLDDAFVSRFDEQAYVGLPDVEQISTLLKSRLSKVKKGKKLAQNEEKIEELAKSLVGYSNRSISFIMDDAARRAKKNNRSDITYKIVKESIDSSQLDKIKDDNFKKEVDKPKRRIGF